VDLLPTFEQKQIIDAVRAHLESRARKTPGNDDFRTAWKQYGDMGWFSLGLPEADGGAGYTAAEEMLLCREIGRFIPAGPFIASMLAARLAAAASLPQAAEIASGTVVVGLAEPLAADAAGPDPVEGTFRTLDADGADLLLAVGGGTTPVTPWAALVQGGADQAPPALPSLDASVSLGQVALRCPPAAASAGPEMLYRGMVLSAAALVGIAERTAEMSAAYAQVREQFGRPIGAFQAVKHRCADMAIRAEVAYAQTAYAALLVSAGRVDPAAAREYAAAKHLASEAAIRNSADNIQNHGAMGFTAEHDAHRYLKRAWVWTEALGAPPAALTLLRGAELTGKEG
jgi:alkylation response protein AidB-like acyl-CoA dehydrogenase